MYIEAVPNRNSPPAILLRESYRHDGKVRKRTLCNLSDWSAAHVEGLRGVLKGGTVIPAERDAFTVTRSLPHGHVAALGTAPARSASTASSAPTAIAAATSSSPCSSAASSTPSPSSPPHERSPPPRRPPALAKCSASARSTTTNSTPRSIGGWSANPPSRRRWPSATSGTAPSCSTTSRRATWREAAVRWPNVDTVVTARRAPCKSSTAALRA